MVQSVASSEMLRSEALHTDACLSSTARMGAQPALSNGQRPPCIVIVAASAAAKHMVARLRSGCQLLLSARIAPSALRPSGALAVQLSMGTRRQGCSSKATSPILPQLAAAASQAVLPFKKAFLCPCSGLSESGSGAAQWLPAIPERPERQRWPAQQIHHLPALKAGSRQQDGRCHVRHLPFTVDASAGFGLTHLPGLLTCQYPCADAHWCLLDHKVRQNDVLAHLQVTCADASPAPNMSALLCRDNFFTPLLGHQHTMPCRCYNAVANFFNGVCCSLLCLQLQHFASLLWPPCLCWNAAQMLLSGVSYVLMCDAGFKTGALPDAQWLADGRAVCVTTD